MPLGGKKFARQVAFLFQGQVLFAASQIAVLLLLVAFGSDEQAGKEQSGIYVLALATTAPLYLFFDLNLRVVRSTDQSHDEVFLSYLGLRICCLLIATVICVALCGIWYPHRFGIFIAIMGFRVSESLSNLCFGEFQRAQQSDRVGKSLSFKGPISIVLISLVAFLSSGSAVMVGFTMAAVSISFSLFFDLPRAWRIGNPETSISAGKIVSAMTDVKANVRIAKRALPLGFDACVSSLALNMPVYFIEATLGTATVGVFGVLMKLAYSIQIFVGAIGHTGVSVLAKLREEEKREQFWRLFSRMLVTSFGVGSLAVVGGTLILPWLLGLVFGAQFNQPILLMTLLVASCLTGSQRIAGRATQACGSYLAYTVFDVIIFLSSAIASWVLIAQFELVGAGIALTVAFAVGLVVTLIHTRFLLWPANVRDASSRKKGSTA